VVAALIEQARSRLPEIRVEEIDVTANPDVAVKYRVMATPAIAIDGQLAFTGVPREEALRARLKAAARGAQPP
jgi:hypothetical protein